MFIAPGQVYAIESEPESQPSSWPLLVHPDYLWHTPLAKTIKQYDYFGYAVHEALHLSEEAIVTGLVHHIAQEYHSDMDNFSQTVIIAQPELLLTYADRFYHRQFLSRKMTNHQVLTRLEDLLSGYFNSDTVAQKGPLRLSGWPMLGLYRPIIGGSQHSHVMPRLQGITSSARSTYRFNQPQAPRLVIGVLQST